MLIDLTRHTSTAIIVNRLFRWMLLETRSMVCVRGDKRHASLEVARRRQTRVECKVVKASETKMRQRR